MPIAYIYSINKYMMKKIRLSDDILNEILNMQLAVDTGDQNNPVTQITGSRPRFNGEMQNTTDTFAVQAASNNRYPVYGVGRGIMQEEEEQQQFKDNQKMDYSLDVLDTMNEQSLKQSYLTFKEALFSVDDKYINDAILVTVKDLLDTVDWSQIDSESKKDVLSSIKM